MTETNGGKRILITGAGRAIGLATAHELVERGHDVVATARDSSGIETRPGLRRHDLDVTSADSVAACLDAVGPLDVIVNNAALADGGPLESFPLEGMRSMVETNVIGPLRMVQAVAPAWRERGSGVIVNISSVQGAVGTPLDGPYAMTKFALEAMSETLHYELGHFGIRTVIVQPGYIAPGMKPGARHPGPAVYDELRAQWEGTDDTVTGGGRTPPDEAARRIADAIEDDTGPLRVRIGGDAEMVLGTRAQLDDAAFEAAMREVLGLTW